MNKALINALISLILVVLISVLLFMNTSAIAGGYGKVIPSYQKISLAKDRINAGIQNVGILDNQIKDAMKQLDLLREQPVQKKYTKDDVHWELDIPHLLIYLDTGAKQSNITLDIDYTKPKFDEANLGNEPLLQGDNTQKTGQKQETNTTDKSEGNKDKKSEDKTLPEPEPIIDDTGFNSYKLPITVYGTYSEIVSFIKYCNEASFIVPYSIHMEFDDALKEVKAKIILRILYINGVNN